MARPEPPSTLPTDNGEGPSTGTGTSTSAHNRHSRTQFPSLEQDNSFASGSSNGGEPFKSTPGIGLGSPPNIRRSSTQSRPGPSSATSSSTRQHDIRRRVRSVHASGREEESVLGGMSPSMSIRRRTLTTQGLSHKTSRNHLGESVESPSDDIGPGVFSDEYDLSHDDPQILEDVQRALKLKARREARKRANSSIPGGTSTSTMASTSYSPLSSPGRPPIALSSIPPAPLNGPSVESEIDFSPSVGVERLHPVPTSNNMGITLDWSNPASEDEKSDKRWSLSLPKKKLKDKPENASKEVLERQETLYVNKLGRIKASAKSATLKKAEITAQQLRRRYSMLYSTLGSTQEPSLTKVVRWYSKLDPALQNSFHQAEPHTWAKHLRDRKEGGNTPRSPWNVSALIVEEYVKLRTRRETMETIPEDGYAVGSPTAQGFSPWLPGSSTSKGQATSDESAAVQLGASLSRRRSHEGHVSFEPLIDSSRPPMAEDNRRRSTDGISKSWRHSLPAMSDSPRSSIYSSIFSGGVSPSSSRMHLRGIARRVRRRGQESDDASSSHQSLSDHDHSHSESGSMKPQRRLRPSDLDLNARTDGKRGDEEPLSFEKSPPLPEDPVTAKIVFTESSPEEQHQPPGPLASPSNDVNTPRIPQRTRLRTSLPNSEPPSLLEEERRQQQVDEEAEHREYERREQLLEQAHAQNARNRQLLQRIATSVKDYEGIQDTLYKLIGLSRTGLSPDLMDALSHDPAVITGSTRGVRGWRAVENIHEHLIRQAETIQTFLQSADTVGNVELHPNALDQHLAGLTQSLDILESRRVDLEKRSSVVAETLSRIKIVHATVKAEYRDAVMHTSAVYPELSHIVALEESYKDNYQQLWEFGMDALTLILDTVTPFWRVYGKIIGEDVTDFLIIPWYRNEFTGEDKRYPIKFPRRSFRHWVGLFVFFCLNVGIFGLQVGGAVASSAHYRYPFTLHPGFWWVVLPTYWSVITVQWCAALVELCIVALQILCVVWWLGWSANIVD